MNHNTHETKALDSATGSSEALWQTLAGCAVFWAGLLALWWML